MLPANLLAAALGKLVSGDKSLPGAAPDKVRSISPLKLEVGQQLSGTVQSQVSAQRFMVRVADQMIQMQLPAFVRSGDLVQVQVAALQPHPEFTLMATTNPVSTSEQLSSAARLLFSLPQRNGEKDFVRAVQQEPLWMTASARPDTIALAEKLHHALGHSGLFYEAHQAQWVAGSRSTPQLLQEPQNQPAPPPQKSPTPGGSAAQPSPVPLAIPAHLQALVQQQLHALETRQVVWQGQAWQGQEMRWEVREERPQRGQPDMPGSQWATELHLALPRLGNLSARLSLNGGAVRLAFEVDNAQASDLLGQASAQLVSALNQHGIPVLQTSISRAPEQPA